MPSISFKKFTSTMSYAAKATLVAALVVQSSGVTIPGTYAAFQVTASIPGNTVTTADQVVVDNVVVVQQEDLADDKMAELLSPSSWFFYNDENDTIDNTLGSFVAGPNTPLLGEGGAQISVSGTQRRNLATYMFRDVPLSTITELSFVTYNPSAGNGGSATRSAYLNFNVSFDGNDTWQRRLNFVPTQNGAVLQDAWQEWDAVAGGTALWGWSGFVANGNQWPDGATSTLRTWNDLLASFPNIRTRASDSWLGLRVGEPYSDGYTENIDSFTFGTTDGWNATTTTYDFEPTTIACEAGPGYFDTFALGSVHNQEGWSSSGSYDQEVVLNTYGFPTFGCQSLRISNAVTSGSFGDQTFSYSVTNEAGETDAMNGGMSGGSRQNHFEAEFEIASTKPTQQPGLFMSVSPDRGDGARMSYLGFTDAAGGIDVVFYDVTSVTDPAVFSPTVVATSLSRAVPHTVKFVIDFVDGPSNDVVEIYIDGVLVHTGTSWENYYRFDDESNPGLANPYNRTVDSLLFRVSGSAVPGNDGFGYLVDNVKLESSGGPNVPSPLATDGNVVLNEFMPNPTGNDSANMPNGEWVELYNNESFDVDLSGWYITDDSGGAGNTVVISSSTALTNISSGTTTIPANGFMVVYMNKAVFNNPGDTVKLFNSANSLKDSHSYNSGICQSNNPTPGGANDDDVTGPCNEGDVPEGKSFARFIDGIGAWIDPEPTPGEQNRFSRQDLIDAGFSEVEIEEMVALLAARGEHLLGEESDELKTGETAVSGNESSSNADPVMDETAEVQPEDTVTDTETEDIEEVVDSDQAEDAPLTLPEESVDMEMMKDEDESDSTDEGQVTDEVSEEPIADDGVDEEELPDPEPDDSGSEVVSEAE